VGRFLAVLEYDGTCFCGSQVQVNQRSVQGEVERALARLNGRASTALFAGRTDSGVHASGQVVAVDTERSMTGRQLAAALNGLMERDVSVREATAVPGNFEPRYWAMGRRYAYRILLRGQRDALRERYVWHLPLTLDVPRMLQAAALLLGRHDFGAFGRAPQGDNTWRSIRHLEVEPKGDELVVVVEADAFLRHMARTLVGTLVDVGRGRLSADDVVASRDGGRGMAVGAAAPAKGLTLTGVAYDREDLGYGVGTWWSCEPLAGAG